MINGPHKAFPQLRRLLTAQATHASSARAPLPRCHRYRRLYFLIKFEPRCPHGPDRSLQ